MFSNSAISDRTGRFMQTALQQNNDTIQAHIRHQRVQIELAPAVAENLTGQIILFALLNLLIRLDDYCPYIDVRAPAATRHELLRLLEPGTLLDELDTFFAPFPAAQYLSFRTTDVIAEMPDLRLVISPCVVAGALSVWADGWVVYLNEEAPDPVIKENTIGAHVAAALAAAEVFKHLIADLSLRPGMAVTPIKRLVFSTYDYRLAAGENPPLPAVVTVDNTVVVGLGGIGSAFVAAATSLPAMVGRLALVDGDFIDETNLNRFLIARPGDTGFKVDLCQKALAFHPEVQSNPEWFDTFVDHRGDRHEIAVVGVDNDRVRRGIQATRPRLILNAGTSDFASFQLTRHNYVHGACLSCIARADVTDHPVEQELAHQLGLDLTTVLNYQRSGKPLPVNLLRQSGLLSEEHIQQLGNRPLAEIQRRLCGQVMLGASHSEVAVSISFLSALPGFLLLGELIKEQNYPHHDRPPLNEHANHLLLSMLGRPHPDLLQGWRDKRPDCDCVRSAYQRAFARKWNIHAL